MAHRVVVTRRIPEEGLEPLLQAQVELWVNPHDRPLERRELEELLPQADGVITLLTDRIDAALMDMAPSCVGFANYAVGFENIEVDAATARGIMVTNTPGVLTEATADLTWALLLAVARRIVEADAYVRQGRFKGWAPMLFLGMELSGKTLGIVGAGRIGTAVARRALGFGMRILYHDHDRKEAMDQLGATWVDLSTLLANSDVVSIHVPLTPLTRHLLDRDRLALMKPSAILVNTARGPVVDERALVDALRAGALAGAGLDVFEAEPALSPGLAELPTVVLAPHIGSATRETRVAMARMAATNMRAMLSGDIPPNLVNPEVIHRRRVPRTP